MKTTVVKIVKWIVFTPIILLAGCLQLEDMALLFKDMRRDQRHEGEDVLARIEGVRS